MLIKNNARARARKLIFSKNSKNMKIDMVNSYLHDIIVKIINLGDNRNEKRD